ncbi:hypothetical protein FNV43_RR07394 [Rhamnella rubrinervis]|uniref:Uncharacterized protein n=1 Tax=Rhamnella rubrinervis TaxID=2594499 RepID=A0A8K0HFP0_9ROSA|nr:hypothetical protein FNV43_RR07394 [Rhamnella rubrinervis]
MVVGLGVKSRWVNDFLINLVARKWQTNSLKSSSGALLSEGYDERINPHFGLNILQSSSLGDIEGHPEVSTLFPKLPPEREPVYGSQFLPMKCQLICWQLCPPTHVPPEMRSHALSDERWIYSCYL